MAKQNNKKGFTLIELLVVISIIGFLAVLALVAVTTVRRGARDSLRVNAISAMRKSLELYANDNDGNYPSSAGECVATTGSVGPALLASRALDSVMVDPSWPTAVPSNVTPGGTAIAPSNSFCYYYYSATSTKDYTVNYYLETDSRAGASGIHVSGPSGEK
ncbi:MAG: hypothetical protein US81_C0004G0008 [Parcubacteria group bacterium GW2011_GWE2_38_18]|nr:MAG: hypothetical protein US81_C0004G0008 [Parcubacteria group bacterium GW2011_GWE2_38_18]